MIVPGYIKLLSSLAWQGTFGKVLEVNIQKRLLIKILFVQSIWPIFVQMKVRQCLKFDST